MTSRQKKGIGFGISGAAFILAGIVFGFTEVNPEWLVPVLTSIGAVGGVLGFTIVLPNVEE